MPWQTIPGLCAKVYIPEYSNKKKKYPCKECFGCQNCSEERCRVCRKANHAPPCPCDMDQKDAQ